MQDIEDTGKKQPPAVITPDGLQRLIDALRAQGYRVVGPAERDEAIVYDDISGTADLPVGRTDIQQPGRYALADREDAAYFGYNVGPHSWKRFLFPPVETLWSAGRDEAGNLAITAPPLPEERFAFIGVRACEIAAMAVQDRVLCEGPHADRAYTARRDNALVIAVNCAEAGQTCFCTSMGTGPKATEGFDLALTELTGDGEHAFLVETGSPQGARLLAGIPHEPATKETIARAGAMIERCAGQMGRSLETDGLKELLQANLDHPQWQDVAERCLSCANCTMVCPTCFCSTVEDRSDLDMRTSERTRIWDSCFTLDFTQIHGGSVRRTTQSRYRQWMTHKLANWIDQFGTSGCVGCGRCITWCPVGIDLTEEAAAIRADCTAGGEA